MRPLAPLTLEGQYVRLEALTLQHVPALTAAAAESRETYAIAFVPAGEAEMQAYVEAALKDAGRGVAVPFATVDQRSGRVVGTTRFGNIEWWQWSGPPVPPVPAGPDALEIGWTWLAASAQRTAINSEAKLLMLDQAFLDWKVRRVTLKTDVRNARSRAAMVRLGAKLDGVLRAHMPSADGGIRDSAVYSILAAEWPVLRERLADRVMAPARRD